MQSLLGLGPGCLWESGHWWWWEGISSDMTAGVRGAAGLHLVLDEITTERRTASTVKQHRRD